MLDIITTSIIRCVASVHSVLFAPLGQYVVTTTTEDVDGTWTDQVRTMTKEQLERWVARVRPDLAIEFGAEIITLVPGASMGLGSLPR